MNLDDFHLNLADPNARGYDLNEQQEQAVNHGDGPLWLLAGPGSGKTEVLVTRTLKLLCVDQVDPRSILLTTFTKKASRNLEDRLAVYLAALQTADPSLEDIDLADLRIGTIHSLCNDILQEYRYPGYQNVRLLEDVEQNLFLYRHAEIVKCDDIGFWGEFDYALSQWTAGTSYAPSRWQRARAAVTLFNHIVEDLVDIELMRERGEHWASLADYYEQYEQALRDHYRCDFAHLLERFWEFITSPAGQQFLAGDEQNNKPLLHILVDEYQDTNPIQERIYLALANRKPYNLTVVGDDDQALYRFRGGTVTCMVNFDQACNAVFDLQPTQIQLDKNYRSHPQIVDFFNEYITSFDEMQIPGVRAPNKLPVEAKSSISGDYPAVNWLAQKQVGDLGPMVVRFISEHLIGEGVIEDYSQCVLLMRSTRDSKRNAGPFLEAFRDAGIPVYNPRSKSFMEAEEVQCLLAALIHVIDPQLQFITIRTRGFDTTVQRWIDNLVAVGQDPAIDTAPLINYITSSNQSLSQTCSQNPGGYLNLNLMEIIYRILAHEPFQSWQQDLERNQRLAKVTRLFESYHSLNLDTLRVADDGQGLSQAFLDRFYYMFVAYLIEAGLDDEEDEDVIVPRGRLPIMTIHQSKGLEFPIVIVGQLGNRGRVGASQILEQELADFKTLLYPRPLRSPEDLALEDDIRLLYVAYSRAQYGLVLVGTEAHLKRHVAIPGHNYTEFKRNTNRPII